ncbi:SUF system NifU family Fe-S cluster assembly protein [bacterium]|nr:SUF system NifU family Fe-S cluster assembly protein [bacterium]|tara:strand:+ start:5349 stop:5795 length:447 start_codon:yes stop_codon:yes gene_type:complete
MSLEDLYRSVILDHYRSARNKGKIENPDFHAVGDNPACGDQLEIFVSCLEDGTVSDVKWNGEGCAICCATASIMTESVKEKSKQEVFKLVEKVKKLIKGELDDSEKDDLGELIVLEGVSKFPVRVKCATLPWVSIEIAMQGKKEASTE